MSFSSYVAGGGTGQDRSSLYVSPGGGMYGGAAGTAYRMTGGKKDSIDQDKRPGRYQKFSDALTAAANYKAKAKAEKEAEKEVDDNEERETQGFKISPDTTVVEGYRDPGFTLKGVEGRSLLGPIGGALSTVFPVTGGIVSAAGSLTGL